ncbi:diacylglycerol/lipid kinase family protein [Lactococcus garvieae]|uniref:diacylglycerol/lipid kinase family protein n=1 Tax=Lactococcus garvieae TaxID=1363 RepID=UPI0009BEE942|nr:diacylglycerol kinase family protein [Lactococcus garvieae]
MKKVKVFYNEKSGKNDENAVLKTIKNFFNKKENQDTEVEFVNPESPEDAIRLSKKATQENTDLVIALGGDGTINKICGGVFEGGSKSLLGIIPNGPVNNLSKSLHIPQDIEAALENINQGKKQKFDIAKVNDNYMISSMTLGILADIAQNVSSTEKKKFGPLAYLKDAYKVIRHNKTYHICLKYNGQTKEIKTKLLLITMTDTIGGRQALSPDAKVDDGLVRVYSLKEIHLWKILFRLNRLRKGKVENFSEITYLDTDHLEISALSNKKKDIPYSRIDGDKSSPLPLDIKVYRKALTTLVPEKK